MNEEKLRSFVLSFGDKASAYVDVVLRELDRFLCDLDRGVKEGSAEDVALAAHSIKSILQQTHFQETAKIASKIESAGFEGDIVGIEPLVSALKADSIKIKALLNAIDDELSKAS